MFEILASIVITFGVTCAICWPLGYFFGRSDEYQETQGGTVRPAPLEEWSECDYCTTFGKTLGFHMRDRENDIHWDANYINGNRYPEAE